MATVPKRLSEKVAFYQNHLEQFAENADALGLTPEEVAELTAQTEAARVAHRAQQEAQNAARAATLTYNLAVAAMANTGAALLEKIRSKAQRTHSPNLFPLAHLPPRATRTPIDAPGTPSRLLPTLQLDGSLLLKWTCPNPRGSVGTVYQVYRRSGNAGWTYLGCVGEKKYVDQTIPAGATALMYKIQAVRSTRTGKPAEFIINFGSNGNSHRYAFQVEPRRAIAPSLAA